MLSWFLKLVLRFPPKVMWIGERIDICPPSFDIASIPQLKKKVTYPFKLNLASRLNVVMFTVHKNYLYSATTNYFKCNNGPGPVIYLPFGTVLPSMCQLLQKHNDWLKLKACVTVKGTILKWRIHVTIYFRLRCKQIKKS